MKAGKAFLHTFGVIVTVVLVNGGAAYAKDYTHSVTVDIGKPCAYADIKFTATRDRSVRLGHCAEDVLVHGETEVTLSCTWKKNKGIVLEINSIRAVDEPTIIQSSNSTVIRDSQGDLIVFKDSPNVFEWSWEYYGIEIDRTCAEWICDYYEPGMEYPQDCLDRNRVIDY